MSGTDVFAFAPMTVNPAALFQRGSFQKGEAMITESDQQKAQKDREAEAVQDNSRPARDVLMEQVQSDVSVLFVP